MVGVPGRSKGCVTCRRRKKGCDLKRPACTQCTSRGLTCEGYDVDRIFIHHSKASQQTIPSGGIVPDFIASITPGHSSTQSSFVDISSCRSSSSDIILPDGLARSAYHEKSIEAFFTMFAPNKGVGISKSPVSGPIGFINILSTLYSRDEALRLSLLAVGTALLGRMNSDEALIRQGRRLYVSSLQEMSKALRDANRAECEALFPMPRIGAMFEILFGADADLNVQAKSWRSHVQGELAMIKSRGPKAHRNSLIAHRIFADGRIVLIIAAVRMRKATMLNDQEWQTVPWEFIPKTPMDLLIDILAGIPEILENIDQITTSPSDTQLRTSTALKCAQITSQLTYWAEQHNNLIYHPENELPVAYSFPELSIAHISITYWITSLLLYEAMEIINSPITNGSTNPCIYARRIALAVPYFFHISRGIWGALTVAFPMGVAMLHLRMTGTEEDKKYIGIMAQAWANPKLPSAIREFLISMRQEAAAQWLEKGWSKERVEKMFTANPGSGRQGDVPK